MKTLAALMFLVACGGGGNSAMTGGDDDSPTADAHIFMDAPPVVASMLKFAGTTSENTQSGETPLAGVTIGIYASSNESTPLATATSDASGNYMLMVPTNGGVLDGYLKATKASYTTNYVYPAAPFATDQLMANANLISSSNFSFLGLLGGQHAGNGVIVVEILDSNSQSVVGAKITSTPPAGAYRYSDSGGTPTSQTGTNTDGAAFLFDVPPGQVSISATKSGMTFKTHGLNAHADEFTTTSILQQ